MSYDLIFARLAPGQTWDDYLEDSDRDYDEDALEEDVAPEVWQRIVQRVREILPSAVDAGGELDDEHTAIQVVCSAEEASIQVPYWHEGAAARKIVTAMYQISAIIEEETGLRGFDPQIEKSTADAVAHIDEAVAVFDNVAASFAAQGITTG
jgi:hypothetical protein